MDARTKTETAPAPRPLAVERKSDRDLVVTRVFDAPARIVFAAWTKPELFMRWWAPKSMGMKIEACEMDVRVGGKYSLTFAGMGTFYGRYLEVVPPSKLVWTNEEGGENGQLTTVTFEEKNGKTTLVMHERYPTKEAMEAEGMGACEVMKETMAQLDEVLADLTK